MKIVKSNILNSKVKTKKCCNCRQKNTISYDDIIWKPYSGFYDENGGYYYYVCKHCQKENWVPTRILKKLKN